MELLTELEHARDIADCGAFSGGCSVVNAMTAELGEGAGTTVEGDRSSAGYSLMVNGSGGAACAAGAPKGEERTRGNESARQLLDHGCSRVSTDTGAA
jgi:hypothetical protein